MEVVVTGRHCEVSDRFREHATEKLARLEKHDHRIMRVHVEVDSEPNKRQHERGVHVELTAFSKGPVIRAEAAAEDKMGALDLALDKMASQMRRAADRRRVHKGRRSQVSTGPGLTEVADLDGGPSGDLVERRFGADPSDDVPGTGSGGADPSATGLLAVEGDGPLVVREKSHAAQPMTLDQALYEMELVGHDFYLYVDRDSERPAVVYRRRGYDYGVISLDVEAS